MFCTRKVLSRSPGVFLKVFLPKNACTAFTLAWSPTRGSFYKANSLEVFYSPKIFYKSAWRLRYFRSLPYRVELSVEFYTFNNFYRLSISGGSLKIPYTSAPWRPSIYWRPSDLEAFYIRKTIWKSTMNIRSSTHKSKTIWSLLHTEVLFEDL